MMMRSFFLSNCQNQCMISLHNIMLMFVQAQSVCLMLQNYGQGPSEKSPLKKAMCSCPPANRMQPPNTPGHLFSELGPVVLPQPRPGPTFPHPPAPPSYGVNNMHAPRAYPSIQVMLPVESTTVVTTTTTSPPPPAMQLTSEAQPSHPLRGLGMGFSSARQQTVPSTGM